MRAPKIGAYLWIYIFQTIPWNQFIFSININEPIKGLFPPSVATFVSPLSWPFWTLWKQPTKVETKTKLGDRVLIATFKDLTHAHDDLRVSTWPFSSPLLKVATVLFPLGDEILPPLLCFKIDQNRPKSTKIDQKWRWNSAAQITRISLYGMFNFHRHFWKVATKFGGNSFIATFKVAMKSPGKWRYKSGDKLGGNKP